MAQSYRDWCIVFVHSGWQVRFTTEKLWSLSNPTFCIFLFVMLLLKLSPAWDSIWRILVSSISGWELEMAAYEGCNTRSLIPTNTTWCKIGGVTRKLCHFLPRLKVWKCLSDISWTSLFFLLFHFMFLLSESFQQYSIVTSKEQIEYLIFSVHCCSLFYRKFNKSTTGKWGSSQCVGFMWNLADSTYFIAFSSWTTW